jgi:hypothetical protein
MEDDLKKKLKTTSKKIEDDLKKKLKLKTNQSTKINLIGCDTIVNSPSSFCFHCYPYNIFLSMLGSVFMFHPLICFPMTNII